MAKPQKIISRVLETKPIAWRSIQFLTPLDHKQITLADYQKLRASLIENHFIEPLIVWLQVNTGTVFCLNGRYRIDCLTELAIEGFTVPLWKNQDFNTPETIYA